MNTTQPKNVLEQFTVVKRSVSYRRVSTDEQADKGFSLPTQLKEIQAYCAKNGIELVADFYDDFTGSSLARTGLKDARQWLRSGKADCIICLDSDRLTREPSHYMLLRDEFKELGTELHYAKRGKVDLNDFGQMLVEDFYGRFAHEWKRKLIEATTRGRRGKVESGHVIIHSRCPYGYKPAMVDGLQTLAIEDSQAAIIRSIYFWYVYQGLSIKAIARKLTEANVPTWTDETGKGRKKLAKGEWPECTIAKMLGDEVYRGRWHYAKSSDTPILVNIPAIIDNDTWLEAQKRKAGNQERKRKEPKREYLLAGRVRCHHCNAPANGKAQQWKSKNAVGYILYYICSVVRSKARIGVTCYAPNFRVDKVDRVVWEWIKGILLDPERLEEGLRRYQEEKAGEAEPLQRELTRTQKLIETKRQGLARAKALYYDGVHTKDEYLRDKRQLEGDINELEITAYDIKNKLDSTTLSPERIKSIHEFAERVRTGVSLAEKDVNFKVRKEVITLLDVTVSLAVEEGQYIAHAACVLDSRALPLSSTGSLIYTEQVYGKFILTARLVIE